MMIPCSAGVPDFVMNYGLPGEPARAIITTDTRVNLGS